MEFDFEKDSIEWAKNTVSKLGYEPLTSYSPITQLFNIIRHIIPPIPREVEVAKGFECPSEYIEGFNQILHEIRQGIDLSPRGSRQQRRQHQGYIDKMLIDWNIYHLHLGTSIVRSGRNEGLIEGCKDIVFIFITEQCAYIIGIFDHQSWTKERVLSIVNENWSYLLEPYRLKGVTGLSREFTDIDRKKLRQNDVNALFSIGNSVFIPPGGGFTLSSFGQDEVRKADIVLEAARTLTIWVNEHQGLLVNMIKPYCNPAQNEKLQFEVGKFVLSRTFTLKATTNSLLYLHIPSKDSPASLIHPAIAPKIEPDHWEKYMRAKPLENNISIEKIS